MASLNSVSLIGRLGKDLEVRTMNGGDSVANFSLATSESWKNKAGEKQERVDWHRIIAWRQLADVCGKYLQKGSMVYVHGRVTYRDWEDKDGVKRSTTEIVADKVEFLDSKPKSDGGNQNSYQPKSGPVGDTDDQIPF